MYQLERDHSQGGNIRCVELTTPLTEFQKGSRITGETPAETWQAWVVVCSQRLDEIDRQRADALKEFLEAVAERDKARAATR